MLEDVALCETLVFHYSQKVNPILRVFGYSSAWRTLSFVAKDTTELQG